jgi:hypothetical protein
MEKDEESDPVDGDLDEDDTDDDNESADLISLD